jgi:hypothetical protein
MEIQIKFTLKLNIDEWGMYKKGDTEEFCINVFDEQNGLVRFPIDKRWDIVSKEIVRVDELTNEDSGLHLQRVTHRYFNLDEAKPKNGKPCIVNNDGDNYHIAFWDEKVNGFVNQTGYLQKEFNKWLYLPINGG